MKINAVVQTFTMINFDYDTRFKDYSMLCPCGTGRTYNLCCQPFILSEKQTTSPEQSMRSRYSAYAVNEPEYIYQTYSLISQAEQSIDDIKQWASVTKWLKLIIHHTSDYKADLANKDYAQVEFSAFYQHLGRFWKMREKSNFILENNLWRYHDGDVSKSVEITKPKRNEICFCASNKKFKHCCMKTLT